MARKEESVAGVTAPAPRLTPTGVVAIASWLGFPLILSALVLDVVAWIVISVLLERCYGVLCVIGPG